MGQSAEELRREIADTRSDLGETMDAIGDRVSPGRIIERRKNRLANGLQSVKDRVMGTASDARNVVADRAHSAGDSAGSALDTVRDAPDAAREQVAGNPLAAGAVAFGLGFLVAAAFPPSRTEEEAVGQVLDKAEPVKEQLVAAGQEIGEHLKESATEAVEQVKQVAQDGGSEVVDAAKDAAETGKEAARDAADSTRHEATS